MLQLVDVGYRAGGQTLFAGLRLQLRAGDRLALVGRNGVGKSTLLRLMAGQLPAEEGAVRLPTGHRVAYLPQEVARQAEGSVLHRVLGGRQEVAAARARRDRLRQQLAGQVAAAAALAAELAAAEQQLALAGEGGERARAYAILHGLGFAPAQVEAPLADLSGGWAMRAELARLLLAQPDTLLLDEPTNHLDAAAVRWLVDHLRSFAGAWVAATHDVPFLRATEPRIAELTPAGLTVTAGGWDAFVAARAAAAQRQAAAEARDLHQRQHLQAFIDRFGATASKARQAQSRQKMLERLPPSMTAAPASRRPRLRLLTAPTPARIVVDCRQLQVRPAAGAADLLMPWSGAIERGDKVALVGPNGVGKSTWLRTLAGILPPGSGGLCLGEGVRPFYLAQHHLELLLPQVGLLAQMQQRHPHLSQTVLRQKLGAVGLGAEAIDRPVGLLSGGQKARVLLAQMAAEPCNLLLLDEPTNHLDPDCVEVLQEALVAFDGTMLLATHDRSLAARLATKVMTLVPGRAPQLSLSTADLGQEPAGPPPPPRADSAPASTSTSSPKPAPQGGLGPRRQRDRLARQLARHEQQVAGMEQELGDIDRRLCSPSLGADAAAAGQLAGARASLQERLDGAVAQWAELAERLAELDA